MPKRDGRDETRRAIVGADRAFPVIEGGRGGGGPPTSAATKGPRCPVTALGHREGRFYFLDVVGQSRELSARALGGRHELLSLFLGDEAWLRERFPRKAKVKRKTETDEEIIEEVTVDFQINRASAFFQECCRHAGLFGDHVVLRRPGVWLGPDKLPAVHCGDSVLIGGVWRDAGYRTGDVVWSAAPSAPRPSTPCDASIGARLQQDLTALFRFRQPAGAIAVLGLIGTAYLGEAASWRSAGFLLGRAGCGKSTLLRVMMACSPLHWFSNDTTKAGLEQGLDGRAMPCFLDETEKSGDNRGAQTLLDLVLTASGAGGTKGARGGIDGTGRRIEVVGSIVMSATSAPEMRETHLGRFAMIELDSPADGEDYRAEHAALIDRMRELGPRLWGRALASYERYQASLVVFRTALGQAGCAPREMDQLGAILAGWWILVQEGAPDQRGAAEGVAALAEFVRTAAIVDEQSNARRLVQYLLTSAVMLDRSTERETIGLLIDAVIRLAPDLMHDAECRVGVDRARHVLLRYGIRVIRHDEKPADSRNIPPPRLGDGAGIWLNEQCVEIARLFEGSEWAAGRWRSGLLELGSARRAVEKAIRVGPVSVKALWISCRDLGFEITKEFE